MAEIGLSHRVQTHARRAVALRRTSLLEEIGFNKNRRGIGGGNSE